MRFLKWVSVLTILAMMFAMLPATVAEDEIVIDMEESGDEELEIDVEDDGFEGLDAIDDASIALDSDNLDLDGLEDNLLISEAGEYTEVSPASNASGDFEIDENGTLTRYGGFDKNVVIPVGVKTIGVEAFHNYANLESVSIPDSVTCIDGFVYGAFQGCTGLKSIELPNSITNLGNWVFEGCTSLTDVTLPNNLEGCGINVFANCTSLKSIVLPNSLKGIGHGMFSGCSNLVSIHLPDNMGELPGAMFADCDSIKDLNFLAGITTIGGSAFSNCDNLKNIIIPNSVTAVGSDSFGNCRNLESVTIHSGVSFIDRTAFNGSDNVVIRGTAGSYAERYANGVGIPFNVPIVTINEKTNRIYDEEKDEELDSLILYINQSYTLNAVQRPADLARTLVWSSSDTNVVKVDQGGTIKGVSQGIATITANTADGKGKAAHINIIVPEPTTITIDDSDEWDEEDYKIILGKTLTIRAYTEVPYQEDTEVDMVVFWSSSDSSIISIESTKDDEVTLKGNKLGKATIIAATLDGGKTSIDLEVVRPEVDSVKIEQSGPIKLYPGKKYSLSVALMPAEAEARLIWSSDDKDVATVNQYGMVTAVEPGDTRIWVETDNELDDSIDIDVLTPPKKITLSKAEATLAVGDTLTLKKKLTPNDAETGFTWSSSNPSIVTVSKKGVVTALEPGTATITVETDNGKSASATITVKPAPTKVKLNKTKATLGVKEKLALKATLSPSKAYTTLTWKSSDKAIAAVSKQGVVTPKRQGTAVITVTTANGKTAKATVTVKAAPKKVTLNKSGTVTLKQGKKLKLKATLPKKTASTLTWKSSNPKVASVDQKGNVRALKKGTAVITVKTFNGKTAKVTVKVK